MVHVDAFGNLITSWAGDRLGPGLWRLEPASPAAAPGPPPADRPGFSLQAGRTYADVAPGALLAYVGSAGVVEIAVREGSAAATTGLRRGDRLRFGRAQ